MEGMRSAPDVWVAAILGAWAAKQGMEDIWRLAQVVVARGAASQGFCCFEQGWGRKATRRFIKWSAPAEGRPVLSSITHYRYSIETFAVYIYR
jgi:hypothetical protein